MHELRDLALAVGFVLLSAAIGLLLDCRNGKRDRYPRGMRNAGALPRNEVE
jgi:hypothetical protein